MAACVRECECAVRDNDALARRKSERGKKCTLKVNRLAIFLYLNSSIKVPMTTVWLAVLSARPRLEPTGAIGGIGAKASAPTSARAKMQAFLYMVTLPVWHSRWIVVLANPGERTMASEQCEQYAAMPSMCTFGRELQISCSYMETTVGIAPSRIPEFRVSGFAGIFENKKLLSEARSSLSL
jgi:hypothetical protein